MKDTLFNKFKFFFCLLIFGVTVFSVGYIYLDETLNSLPVTEKAESVPYYTQNPDNTTLKVEVCGEQMLFDLNFETKLLTVLKTLEDEDLEELGYTVDYTLGFDYEVVGFLVDSVGGIELLREGKALRYTGVQITQMLTFSNVSMEEKSEILKAVLNGIAQNGFSKENLLYLLEHSETNLKFTECFSWVEHIPELCKFIRYID